MRAAVLKEYGGEDSIHVVQDVTMAKCYMLE